MQGIGSRGYVIWGLLGLGAVAAFVTLAVPKGFIAELCSAEFMPHGHCYFWRPDILWLHVGSDAGVALSYFAIPFCLVTYARRKKGLKITGVLWLFSGFILFCGMTHLLEIYSVWHGAYYLTGSVKLLTALISLTTAAYLIRALPTIMRIPLPHEMREVESKLSSRESLFEAILKGGVDGFVTFLPVRDSSGAIVDFAVDEYNEVALDEMRKNVERAAGSGVEEAFAFAGRIGLRSRLVEALECGLPLAREIDYLGSGEVERSLSYKIVPAGDRLAFSFLDTTPIRRAERDLKAALERSAELAQRESDIYAARAEAAMAAATHGVVILNEAGAIVQVNKRVESVFGYAEAELLGAKLERLIPGAEEALSGGRLSGMRKDGSSIPLELGLNPFSTREGRFVIASVSDLSEQVEARRALEESELRFQQAANGGNVGVWHWLDVQGEEQWWSPNFFELLDYEQGEIAATLESFQSILHPHDHLRTFELLDECLSGLSPFALDYRLRCKGGEYRWFYGTGTLVKDRRSERVGMIGSIQDIQFRKDTEDELKAAHDELEARNEEMQQMMYAVSHDLKSPLISIRGLLQLIQFETGESERKALELLGRVDGLAAHMGELIADLLELGKVGHSEETIEAVDANKVLEDVRALLSGESQGADCRWLVHGSLPTLRVSRLRLRQLLQNLCSNAVKYGQGEGVATIEIGSRDDAEFVEIYVKDSGPGIPQIYRKSVFELFNRIDTSKEGTGVGLAIVEKIMALYGGSVELRSELGQGSEFVLRFPRERWVESSV